MYKLIDVKKEGREPTDEVYINGTWVRLSAIAGDNPMVDFCPIRREIDEKAITCTIEDPEGLKRIVSFPVFQANCYCRKFIYAGKPGQFNVHCRETDNNDPESNRCNSRMCPIWNSRRVEKIHNGVSAGKSLKDINLSLKEGENCREKIEE